MPAEGDEENFEKFHYFYSPYDCDRKCEGAGEKGDKLEISQYCVAHIRYPPS